MFEVGKKYKFNNQENDKRVLLCECVVGDYGVFTLINDTDRVPRVYGPFSYTTLQEYKEPRTLSRWFNVWEKPDGTVILGSDYETREECSTRDAKTWKRLDIIEVAWKEKV